MRYAPGPGQLPKIYPRLEYRMRERAKTVQQ